MYKMDKGDQWGWYLDELCENGYFTGITHLLGNRLGEVAKDSTIFEKYWDTKTLFPYKEVDMSSMPKSVVIDLIDSLTGYHCPYQGSVHPRGKYGPRRRRQHQGVDLPLKTGDPVYATFCGRVRISEYNKGCLLYTSRCV